MLDKTVAEWRASGGPERAMDTLVAALQNTTTMQEDEFTGRVSYLGTGIGTLAAAKRYLHRKFRESPLPPVVSRPGARFYVTARQGKRTAYLLGPYVSHMTALAAEPRAQKLLRKKYPTAWVSVGTASRPDTVPTQFGR